LALPMVELLEERQVPSVIMVMSNQDTGANTLRAAITTANMQTTLTTIEFAIGTGPQTIAVASALPAIMKPVLLDGTMQPGFAGTPLITLTEAQGFTGQADGLDLNANGCTVQGLMITGFTNGISIASSNNTIGGSTSGFGNVISGNSSEGVSIPGAGSNVTGNVIQGNKIGTDAAGTIALANGLDGISALGAASTTIGGTTAAERNIISGNSGSGIDLGGTGNLVEGNYIGTNAAGSAAIPNDLHGIADASQSTIGGTAAGAGNVISGNKFDGLVLGSNNLVQANLIGTDVTGTVGLGNGGPGIFMMGSESNIIGGTTAAASNVISGNAIGIEFTASVGASSSNLVEGNKIGLDVTGLHDIPNSTDGIELITATSNTIGGTITGAANLISGNGGNGIVIEASVVVQGPKTSTNNVIEGNTIGLTANGTALGNGLDGIQLLANALDNTIGGTASGAGNTISGNARFGILLSGATLGTSQQPPDSNVIQGNRIGTNAAGTMALPNHANGIDLYNATNNTIGGTLGGAGNIISGNSFFGILFSGGNPSGNVVQGNLIGTDVTATIAVANGRDGIDIGGASGNTIGGPGTASNVISGNTDFGIYLYGASTTGTQILGNLVGSTGGGNVALPNALYGVLIADGANANTVGGTMAGQGNLLSGNTDFGAYLLGASNNVLEGNLIGVNLAGTAKLANGVEGVEVLGGASGNTIGGTTANAGNVISGNGRNGVLIAQTGSNNNLVQGNFIGTDRSGTLMLGNGYQGVGLVESAASNTVGGTVSGAANTIAFNTSTGVTVGTAASDTAAVGNALLGNLIYQNGGAQGLGIDLGNNGVTANGSGPSGPNHFQNNPGLGSLTVGPTTVQVAVSFTSVPSSTFRLEFFMNPLTFASPQGRTFVGAVSVTTGSNGKLATATALTAGVTVGSVDTVNNFVNVTLPISSFAGALTATATVLSVGSGQTASLGDTSEFSAADVFSP
jgi:titin